jgi:enoyl-CoA hydratase/carnithine racemase
VVLPINLVSETEVLVDKLASLPPIALQMTKKAVIHAYENELNSHLELMSAFQAITQRSSDHFRALDGMMNSIKPTFEHY